MTDRPPSRAGAAVFVFVAGSAFATSSPLARYALPAHPLVIAFGRLAIAAVLLLLFDIRGIGRAVSALTTRQRLAVAAGGALLGGHFACYQWGLAGTSIPAAASLVSLEPISVVLVAWALFGIRPRRVEQGALALATAGAVVVGSAAGSGEHKVLGDLGVLAAVVFFGLYLAVARSLPKTLPTQSYAALVYAGAAVTTGLLLPWSPDTLPPGSFDLPVRSILSIAALAVVPTLIGHTAVQGASRRLPPAVVALGSPIETLGSIALGMALLGERPSSREVAGAALILAGTTLALLSHRPEQPDAAKSVDEATA